ncbi:ankyrin repeat-containing domain protein [Catenaria anguillulae PL171]|uniref:Ankyrin repeat-containing domain protein n=1 Tax=Catenaria anguillulae PL171 TaxID=765915 RepID=A0A1Y2HRA0_9FUNG|nr:ankyrin repeat-containing domain protein [Catenaria anguillulae PL171]
MPNATAGSSTLRPGASTLFDAAHSGNLAAVLAHSGFDTNPDDLATVRARLNARDDDDRTALHWACSGSAVQVADWLLHHGADPNVVDDSGWTPLMIAASVGCVPIVRMLVAKGVDVNKQNESGATAAHYAASKNRLDVLQVLVGEGKAKVDLVDRNGQLPILPQSSCRFAGTHQTARDSCHNR